jgi:hypothetical protein
MPAVQWVALHAPCCMLCCIHSISRCVQHCVLLFHYTYSRISVDASSNYFYSMYTVALDLNSCKCACVIK